MIIYIVEGSDRYHDSGSDWIVKGFKDKTKAQILCDTLNGLVRDLNKPRGYRKPIKEIRKEIYILDPFIGDDSSWYQVNEVEVEE